MKSRLSGLVAIAAMFVVFYLPVLEAASSGTGGNYGIDKKYGNLDKSIRHCKCLSGLLAQDRQIVILDIGCAAGDFVKLFHNVKECPVPTLEYVAFGVDPLIKQYQEYYPGISYNLYSAVYETVVCDTEKSVDFHVNTTQLDLSSIYDIDVDGVKSLPPYYQGLRQQSKLWIIKNIAYQSITLDWLCHKEGISKIDILKLDTQGNEYEILCSMSEQLLKNTATIYVETSVPNKECLYKNQAPFEKIYEFMIEKGFHLLGIYGLDNSISLENSIDVNCIFINGSIYPNPENLPF
jgi:FkbM family methyltransferase